MPVSNGNYQPHPTKTLAAYIEEGRVSRILDRVDTLTLTDKQNVTVFDFGTIYVTGKARLTAFGTEGTVYASDEAEVLVHGDITVIAVDAAKVHAYDRVRAVINGNSQAVFHHSSRGTLRDQAVGTFFDASTGGAHNMSRVDVHDAAQVSAYDMTAVAVHGTYAGVRARGAVVVTVTDGYPSITAESANVKVHVPAGLSETAKDGTVSYRNVVGAGTIITAPARRPEDQTLQVPADADKVAYQQGGSVAEDRALAAAAGLDGTTSAGPIAPASPTAPAAGATGMAPPSGLGGPRHQAAAPPAVAPVVPSAINLTGGGPVDDNGPDVVSIGSMRAAGLSIFGQEWTPIVAPAAPPVPTSLPQ